MSSKTIKQYEAFKRVNDYARFADLVAERLAKGEKEYGDKSFSRDPVELIDELQAECLDLAGWGFVLHTRLEAVKAAAEKLMAEIPPPPPPEKWGVFYRDEVGGVDRSGLDPKTYPEEAQARLAAEMLSRLNLPGTYFAQRVTAVHQ
jgi:hypothetical protein